MNTLKELMKNIFSRLKQFRLNKIFLLLIAVALCAIAISLAICYIISSAHPPVNIQVDFHFTENYAILPIWPAVISAAGGVLSSIIGGASQSSTNKNNLAIMREQNQFNATEAQKNRDWQTSQWWSQFRAENAYNDPKNQMARLEAAGINPFIAAENTTKIGSTAANPSVPSGAVAQAVNPATMVSPWAAANIPQNIQNLAGVFSALAEAKKTGLDTKLTEETFDTLVSQVNENLKTTQLQNKFQEIQNEFEPLVKKYGLQKTWSEYLKALSDRDVNAQRVQEVFQNTLYLAEQRAKTRADREQIEKLTPVLVEQNEELTNLYREKQETERHHQHELDTQASKNVADARKAIADGNYTLALQKTEDALREHKVDLASSQSGKEALAFLYDLATFNYHVESESWSPQKVEYEARKLKREAETVGQGYIGKEIIGIVDLIKHMDIDKLIDSVKSTSRMMNR